MKYLEFIERTQLIREVESCTTTGDPDYPGTALEVSRKGGPDILHVVVDGTGEQQVLFMAAAEAFRIPLSLLEKIVESAKEAVKATDG